MGISAKVIAHSSYIGDELITLEVEFHRFILAEINTHRVLSRNYQSSRAVPVKKMIAQVINDPAIPVHFGENQRGMVAERETDNVVTLDTGFQIFKLTGEDAWRMGAVEAARLAEAMDQAKYHKQIVNRVLEPYVWTKGVITGTRKAWDSVLKLRLHKDAQPEFKALAKEIKLAIDDSLPTFLKDGQFHLPYVQWLSDGNQQIFCREDINSLEDAIKVSTSCCGQVSYRMLNDSLEKAMEIYDLLNLPSEGIFKEDPPHFSPCEHQAMAYRSPSLYESNRDYSGNFNARSFYQYRKMLEIGKEKYYIEEYHAI